jgi:hypothetical protein
MNRKIIYIIFALRIVDTCVVSVAVASNVSFATTTVAGDRRAKKTRIEILTWMSCHEVGSRESKLS